MITIEKLNNLLNTFEWNCVVKNKIVKATRKNWEKYRVLTPKQFITLKTGCCWDFCNFLQFYFPRHFSYPYKLYFLQAEDKSNHTWFCYFKDNTTYIFESAWKKYCGIYEYNSEDEMLDDYVYKFFNDEEYDKYSRINYKIYIYKSIDKVLPDDFLNNIYDNGKLIRNSFYERKME